MEKSLELTANNNGVLPRLAELENDGVQIVVANVRRR